MPPSKLYASLLVLGVGAGVAGQTTNPTTKPTKPGPSQSDTDEALRLARDAEKQGILKQLAGYPNLPPAKLGEVVILGLHAGHLTMQTRLPPTSTPSRLEITDLPGICTLTLREVDNAPVGKGAYEPDLFLLERYRFDQPNATVSCMTVEALPTSVQLAWSGETLTGMSQVSMVEQVGPTGPVGDQVPANIVLRATEQPNDNDDGATTVELKAPDFLTLRREHPAEVEKYLGPIIRELRAEAVLLPPDTVLAWQVFSTDAKPNPELAAAIREQLKRLDADDSGERAAARQSLEKLGPPAAVELSRMDRSKLSPEQTSVVDGLIREFKPVSPETAKRLRDDPAFLLSCLADTDDFIVQTAFAHLQKLSKSKLEFDFAMQGPARHAAVEKLRQQFDQRVNREQ